MKTISAIGAHNNRIAYLVQWILEVIPNKATILEVGAGSGHWRMAVLKNKAQKYVGIDPDATIQSNSMLDEYWVTTLESFSATNEQQYDIIFSHMVLEHVQHPVQFIEAAAKLLKPGGYFFAVTPNRHHYFTALAHFASKLNLQDTILKMLRGAETVEGYHFATSYQLNSISALDHLLTHNGFIDVTYHMLENPLDFECYFPKPLKFFPYWHSAAMYTLHLPTLMGTIIFCARKAE